METVKGKKNNGKNFARVFDIKRLVTMAMLGGVAVVLMQFSTPLWFAPPFYELDLSEIPVLIGSFAMGPVAGIIIEFIKIMLDLVISGTKTMFVGEFANFLMGCSLVVTSSLVYNYKKTKEAAAMGLAAGTICLVVVASILNAYVLLPTYAIAFKLDFETLIAMGTEVNPIIKNLKTFIILAVAPFNLVKGLLSSLITFLLYKKISSIIKSFNY